MLGPQKRHSYASYNGAQTISRSSKLQQHYQRPTNYVNSSNNANKTESLIDHHALLNRPLCRCRVMYLGSAVPHITKNGLHGIQEPLRHLYPEEQFSGKLSGQAGGASSTQVSKNGTTTTTIDISHLSASLGIDSWLSVWSNGLLLENVDEFGRDTKRFFSIECLHYCAAVRFFNTSTLMNGANQQESQEANGTQQELIGGQQQSDQNNNTIGQVQQAAMSASAGSSSLHQQQRRPFEAEANGGTTADSLQHCRPVAANGKRKSVVRFLPLDAPLFQCPAMVDANHPPVFAAILRRTTGIKVLECHAFICRRDAAANALVRCCTHAYADLLSAKRLSSELGCSPLEAWRASGHQQRRFNYDKHHNNARRPHETLNGSNNILMHDDDDDDQKLCRSGENQTIKQLPSNSSSSNCCDDDNNSIEASSGDDNYAIISKRQQPRQQASSVCGPETTNSKAQLKQAAGIDAAASGDIGQALDQVRSTRSLFDDFQPKVVASSGNKVRQTPYCAEKLSHSLDLMQLGDGRDCCGPTESGIGQQSEVKRHSKSMQNLEGPFEFCASSARSSSRAKRNQRYQHKRERTQSERANEQRHQRKAISVQDVAGSVNQYPQQQNGSANESSSSRLYSAIEQQQPERRQRGVPEVGLARSRRPNVGPELPAIPASTSHSSGRPSRRRRAPADGDHSTVSRQRRSRSRGATMADQLMEPQMGLNATGYPLYCLPQAGFKHGLYGGAGAGQPAQPIYLPGGYYLAPPYHQPHPAPPFHPYYDQLSYLAAGAPTHMPYIYPQQRQIYAQANGLATMALPSRRPKSGHLSSTLARFRRLSPPANLLSGHSATEAEMGNQQQVEQEQPEVSSIDTSQQTVVSAQPSFLSSRATTKKMGWIKRLSLTMSASTGAPSAAACSDQPDGSQRVAVAATSVKHTPTGTARKRRSSLFTGSLSLGRSGAKQQHQAKLIQAQS